LTIAAYVTYTCGKVIYNSMLPDIAGANERGRVVVGRMGRRVCRRLAVAGG